MPTRKPWTRASGRHGLDAPVPPDRLGARADHARSDPAGMGLCAATRPPSAPRPNHAPWRCDPWFPRVRSGWGQSRPPGSDSAAAAQNLEDPLSRYMRLYNHHIPQRASGHIPPVQALQDWQEKCPRLFKKKACNLMGLDTSNVP